MKFGGVRTSAGFVLLARICVEEHDANGKSEAFRMGYSVLVLHSKAPGLEGRWSLPRGNIEPGENVEQAALRELSEETFLDPTRVEIISKRFGLEPWSPLLTHREWTPFPRRHVAYDKTYRYELAEYRGKPQEARPSHEHSAAEWIPLDTAWSAPRDQWAYAHLALMFVNIRGLFENPPWMLDVHNGRLRLEDV